MLLQAGADADARDEDGDTPLLYTAYFGHVELARALLGSGVDVSSTNDGGAAVLHT